jgi:hypothetical protein
MAALASFPKFAAKKTHFASLIWSKSTRNKQCYTSTSAKTTKNNRESCAGGAMAKVAMAFPVRERDGPGKIRGNTSDGERFD